MIVIIELAAKSVVIKPVKLNLMTVLVETTLDDGTILDERVIEPVTVNEAEEKTNDMAEGRVRVIYPLALNLELTLYVIV